MSCSQVEKQAAAPASFNRALHVSHEQAWRGGLKPSTWEHCTIAAISNASICLCMRSASTHIL